jgi:hypothetical protein
MALDGPRQFTFRERCNQRFQSMQALRKPYEMDYDEIARLALPSRSSFLGNNTRNIKRRANTSKQDTAGRLAGRTLVNGMSTGMSSSARPWMKATTPDPDLAEFGPVKEWLAHVQTEIYNLFATTNYYEANKVAYAQLGHMGTACNFGIEHPSYLAVWHAMEAGEYWLSQDDGLRVDGCARRILMTVQNAVHRFEWRKLSNIVQNAYNRGDVHMLAPFVNLVEFNRDRDARYFDVTNKPWRSIWWEEGNTSIRDDSILEIKGYDSKPFSAPRWETTGAQVYSDTAPAYDALPDLRELELVARRMGRGMDNLVKPALNVPAGLQQTPISVDPGSLNFINELQGRVEPTIRPDPNVLIALERRQDFLTKRVEKIMYADLWMAITDMEGIQPKNEQELFFRNEEKLTQLGPVVDRVNIEKLEVDIDRAYTILDNLGRIRPAPPELARTGIQIQFTSILAQAQQAAQNTQIERAARFVGFIAGLYPEAALKFDAEQAIDEYAINSGTNPKIIRTDEIVAKMKAELQAQQQAQQMKEMAPAAAQGAQAAQLLSQTQVGPEGVSMLDQMMGV